MPTGARGEGYLELDGKRYELLFTNRALADAERLTGRSVMLFLRDAATMSMTDLVQYVAIGLRYAQQASGGSRRGGNETEMAWRLLDEHKMTPVARVVLEAIGEVLDTGDTDSPPE